VQSLHSLKKPEDSQILLVVGFVTRVVALLKEGPILGSGSPKPRPRKGFLMAYFTVPTASAAMAGSDELQNFLAGMLPQLLE
jgi:hypothetical protein